MVRVGVRVGVSVRDSFSVLLRAQHYSMLTTFGSVSTANNKCGVVNSIVYKLLPLLCDHVQGCLGA